MPKLTNSEIIEEFTNLKEYVEDLGYLAEIVQPNRLFDIPTLAILIPYGEEDSRGQDTEGGDTMEQNSEDGETVEQDTGKLVKFQIYCNFLPFDDEEAEFTKYLHLYSELDIPEPQIPEISIYKAINRINGLLTIGSLLYKEKTEDQPPKIQYRYTLANTRDTLVDEGAFCESLFLMITNLGVTEQVMGNVLDGVEIDSLIDRIMSGRV